MFFTLLVLVAALALESLGSYISVVGLSQNTSIIIIFLAILLDFVKVIIATTLYKKWKSIHFVLKSFLLPALVGLMLVTSSGTYGYLIKEFGKTSVGQEEIAMKIKGMQEEKERIETRKKEIDSQIAALPSNSVNQRKRLTDLFGTELNQINHRILELDKSIPEANLQNLQGKSTNGNLASIASTYGMQADQVNKIVAFLITLMIDPLAIVLLTIANFLMDQYKKDRKEQLLKDFHDPIKYKNDSMVEQLKNKIPFFKNNPSKEDVVMNRYLAESKPHIIKQPLMSKVKEQILLFKFINTAKLIENPKIIVPIKYQYTTTTVNSEPVFKESRPELIKIEPTKNTNKINTIQFILNSNPIEPSYITVPLKRIRKEFLEEELFLDDSLSNKPINLLAEKKINNINIFKFITKLEKIKPKTITFNKENIEKYSFLNVKQIEPKQLIKTIEKNDVVDFISNIEIIQSRKFANGNFQSIDNEEILNEPNDVAEQVTERQNKQQLMNTDDIKKSSLKIVVENSNVKKTTNPFGQLQKKISLTQNQQHEKTVVNYYSTTLDIPIEYTETVIFHDEYEDFQPEDLGDLVLKLWEENTEDDCVGFDTQQLLTMKEIEI